MYKYVHLRATKLNWSQRRPFFLRAVRVGWAAVGVTWCPDPLLFSAVGSECRLVIATIKMRENWIPCKLSALPLLLVPPSESCSLLSALPLLLVAPSEPCSLLSASPLLPVLPSEPCSLLLGERSSESKKLSISSSLSSNTRSPASVLDLERPRWRSPGVSLFRIWISTQRKIDDLTISNE